MPHFFGSNHLYFQPENLYKSVSTINQLYIYIYIYIYIYNRFIVGTDLYRFSG